ncbi:MAG: hypothetical protein HYU02_02365 [Thaumarchaeota archaeon]|nr:hypothetical protein [Nitrososphaerota archaeon]
MENLKPIVLPFALGLDEKGRNIELSRDVELALVFYMTRRELKELSSTFGMKLRVGRRLKEGPQVPNATFAMKLYYPAWVTPVGEGRGLIIDALGLLREVLRYDELPDCDLFLREIKESPSIEAYLATLKSHIFTFLDFGGSRASVSTLITNSSIISDLQTDMIHYSDEPVANALSLNPTIPWQDALKISEMLRSAGADIERMSVAKEELTNRTSSWLDRQNESVEALRKEYLQLMGSEAVEAKIDELHQQRRRRVSEIEDEKEKEVAFLESERTELENEMAALKQKRPVLIQTLQSYNQQRPALLDQLAEPQKRRNELLKTLSTLTAQLENEKAEQLRLADMAETRVASDTELAGVRERLSQLALRIAETGKQINEVEHALRIEEEKREALQGSIIKLTKEAVQVSRQISELDASLDENDDRIGVIPHLIEGVRRRKHEEILQVDREYLLKATEARTRVGALRADFAGRIDRERRIIKEVSTRSERIASNIDELAKRKSTFIKDLKSNTVFVPRKIELTSPGLLQIPFYLVAYSTPVGRKYILYPPLTAYQTKKAFLAGRLSVRARMKSLDIIREWLLSMLQSDYAFEDKVGTIAEKMNILTRPDTWEKLVKGLTQLKNRGWISKHTSSKVITTFSEYFRPKEETPEKEELYRSSIQTEG